MPLLSASKSGVVNLNQTFAQGPPSRLHLVQDSDSGVFLHAKADLQLHGGKAFSDVAGCFLRKIGNRIA